MAPSPTFWDHTNIEMSKTTSPDSLDAGKDGENRDTGNPKRESRSPGS